MKNLLALFVMLSCFTALLNAQLCALPDVRGKANSSRFEEMRLPRLFDGTAGSNTKSLAMTRNTVYLGDPNSPDMYYDMPVCYYYGNTLVQTIYTDAEVAIWGTISKLTYTAISLGDAPVGEPIKIWLGTTTLTEFDTEWVPYESFELVYEGSFDLTEIGVISVEVELDTPYEYAGGNLVVMTNKTGTSHYVFDPFWHQTRIGEYRSVIAMAETEPFDPAVEYPVVNYWDVWLETFIPNVALTFSSVIQLDNDLRVVSFEGQAIAEVGTQVQYSLNVLNAGSLLVSGNDYSVKLMSGELELASITGTNLESLADFTFTFMHAFNAVGNHTLHAYIDFSLDENNANNASVSKVTYVIPENSVYVGNPSSTGFWDDIPIAYTHYNSLSQVILLPEEINKTGEITKITYFANSYGDDISGEGLFVYMGNTSCRDFSTDDWAPYTDFEQVYFGWLDVPEFGRMEIEIELDTPFHYTGGNLAIMINKTGAEEFYPAIRWQQTEVATYRGAYARSSDDYFNPEYGYPVFEWPDINYLPYIANVILQFGSGTAEEDIAVVPQKTGLLVNYPNPFNPETTIMFSVGVAPTMQLAEWGGSKGGGILVHIDIYNIKGQKIRELVNGHYSTGTHSVIWNGTDNNGKQVSSGIYFYKMTAGDYTSTRKMILLK
jgi:hypothetical protein